MYLCVSDRKKKREMAEAGEGRTGGRKREGGRETEREAKEGNAKEGEREREEEKGGRRTNSDTHRAPSATNRLSAPGSQQPVSVSGLRHRHPAPQQS